MAPLSPGITLASFKSPARTAPAEPSPYAAQVTAMLLDHAKGWLSRPYAAQALQAFSSEMAHIDISAVTEWHKWRYCLQHL